MAPTLPPAPPTAAVSAKPRRRRRVRRRAAWVGWLRTAAEVLGAGAAGAAVVGVWFTYDAVRLTNLSIEVANTALEEDRVNRAWALVAAAKSEGTGNLGLVQAIETLASRGIDLNVVKLPGAYLLGVKAPRVSLVRSDLSGSVLQNSDLSKAYLAEADLSNANLIKADLSAAILRRASFYGAGLDEADLSGADLRGASLNGANLTDADLSGAKLNGTNLFKANLSGARGLTQQQLNQACGHPATKVPDGMKPPTPCWGSWGPPALDSPTKTFGQSLGSPEPPFRPTLTRTR
jgi:uncharacterized protein YjbI with pentapeptide repeats